MPTVWWEGRTWDQVVMMLGLSALKGEGTCKAVGGGCLPRAGQPGCTGRSQNHF